MQMLKCMFVIRGETLLLPNVCKFSGLCSLKWIGERLNMTIKYLQRLAHPDPSHHFTSLHHTSLHFTSLQLTSPHFTPNVKNENENVCKMEIS